MQSLQADQSLYNRKGVCYISLFNGLWQVYSHSGINGERKFTTFLEINSKTPDESLNHVTESRFLLFEQKPNRKRCRK